ncbi:MAG: hypothetical protein IPO98_00365 [Saprospiraceae bacterium]|nr:hypothetical protein [Saprospiraceae bacterium]
MKNLFVILIMLTSSLSYGQNSRGFSLKSDNEFITIILDENKFPGYLSVVKKIDTFQNGTPVQLNELHLVGDFIKNIDGKIILDYEKFNYYYAPFSKPEPFIWLNKNKRVKSGILDFNRASSGGGGDVGAGGDFIYWCTCGGHTADSQTPGGCVSSLQNNVVRCIKDGECNIGCVGSAVTSRIISGGGVFIQTSKKIVHDFRIK